jgi:hypothetical protein
MRLRLLLLLTLVTYSAQCRAHSSDSSGWTSADLAFRPVAITTNGAAFWSCGSGESIATSTDGQNWQIRHRAVQRGAILLGIAFRSSQFGYACGTGGVVLTTNDGGMTWDSQKVGDETILLASLSDPTHGLLRTASSLLYFAGNTQLKPVPIPPKVPKSFRFTPSLVALSPLAMTAELSEGLVSEAGFVSTVDGGKSWTFYDPPSTVIRSFLRVDQQYWAVGHEVVGKDKPGGGYSVPLAMQSTDARTWTHTTVDIRPCHWEVCTLCTVDGCLASDTLIVNPFGTQPAFFSFPKGHLTAKWAATSSTICSVGDGINCTRLRTPLDTSKAGEPQPPDETFPELGAKPQVIAGLRCVLCSVPQYLVDDKVEGRYTVHIDFLVRSDGTVGVVTVKSAPSEKLRAKFQAQALNWLFEPPTKQNVPVNVKSGIDVQIMVFRSQ